MSLPASLELVELETQLHADHQARHAQEDIAPYLQRYKCFSTDIWFLHCELYHRRQLYRVVGSQSPLFNGSGLNVKKRLSIFFKIVAVV